ncbi:MAG: hypothetical protein GY861_24425 [bacterium]|nr:hypothetical protein [bacterium]
MADKVIENLITQLSFDYDKKALDAFAKQSGTILKSLTAIVATSAAAAVGMFAFAKSTATVHDELGKLNNITDVSLQSLQELGYAADIDGGSINSMNSSILNLSTTISQAARGIGSGVEVFGMLGMSATDAEGNVKSADIVLEELSDRLSVLRTDAEKLEFTRKLGIDDSVLRTLKRGSDGIRAIREEARQLDFIIDEDAAEAAAIFNDELIRTERLSKGIKDFIGTNLIKQFIPLIEKFNEWTMSNRELVKTKILEFLERLQKFTMGVYNVGVRVVRVIDDLVKSMGGWENAIIVVTGLLVAMNASALLMPILAAALAAGLFLIIEDIQKFANEGDSVLGQLADEFPIVDTAANLFLDTLGLIAGGWGLILTDSDEAWEGMQLMFADLISWASDFISDIWSINNAIANGLIAPLNTFLTLLNAIPGVEIPLIAKSEVKPQTGALAEAGQFSADVFNSLINQPFLDLYNSTFGTTLGSLAKAEQGGVIGSPRITPISNTITERSNITNNENRSNIINNADRTNNENNANVTNNATVTINIEGGDKDTVKKGVMDALNETFQSAEINLSSGVTY